MENEKSLVRATEVRLPKFVESAYDTIEGMKQFANMLLESKLVPDSYYEKGADNKPDYTKGKTSAVVVVLLQAQQLAVPPMTALQHIVPVNGLLSIKGDLAKTMIFASGKLRKDTWVETVTGSIEDGNMMVSITATRDDNGITMTRTFSVDKAKRMGLWVTAEMVNGSDGWKHKKSAWYKTPDRMLQYRALGNLARDLFSDVLLNMYTTEEAVDIQNDTTTTIETESGAKITIPDKEHAKQRSGKMTDRVADKIPDNKFGAVTDVQPVTQTVMQPTVQNVSNPADESPFTSDRGSVEVLHGEVINRDEAPAEDKPEVPGQYTLAGMERMETKDLLVIINDDMDMMDAMETIPGKNTNKKLREIIFAHQNNGLAEYVAPYLAKKEEEQPPIVPLQPVNTQAGEIPINKGFDQKAQVDTFLSNEPLKKEEKKVEAGNKYGIDIPVETPRDFSYIKQLFNKMMGLDPQITTPRYMTLSEKLGLIGKYPDKEALIKFASVEEINSLLDAN